MKKIFAIAFSFACSSSFANDYQSMIAEVARETCSGMIEMPITILKARQSGLSKAAMLEMIGPSDSSNPVTKEMYQVKLRLVDVIYAPKPKHSQVVSDFIVDCNRTIRAVGNKMVLNK
jgi:hypothetical protein